MNCDTTSPAKGECPRRTPSWLGINPSGVSETELQGKSTSMRNPSASSCPRSNRWMDRVWVPAMYTKNNCTRGIRTLLPRFSSPRFRLCRTSCACSAFQRCGHFRVKMCPLCPTMKSGLPVCLTARAGTEVDGVRLTRKLLQISKNKCAFVYCRVAGKFRYFSKDKRQSARCGGTKTNRRDQSRYAARGAALSCPARR